MQFSSIDNPNTNKNYKTNWVLIQEERIRELNKINECYPTKTPIIIERMGDAHGVPDVSKPIFLAPDDIHVLHLTSIVRSRLQTDESYEDELYLFVDNRRLLKPYEIIGEVYAKYRDADDGFLYLAYSNQRPFSLIRDVFNLTNLILVVLIISLFYFFIL